MPNMDTHVTLNTEALFALNYTARENKFSRTLSDAFLRRVDPYMSHIVVHSYIHSDKYVRATLAVYVRGQIVPVHATLDIDIWDYINLPRVRFDEVKGVMMDEPSPLRKKRRFLRG